jgi:hypothetical protein
VVRNYFIIHVAWLARVEWRHPLNMNILSRSESPMLKKYKKPLNPAAPVCSIATPVPSSSRPMPPPRAPVVRSWSCPELASPKTAPCSARLRLGSCRRGPCRARPADARAELNTTHATDKRPAPRACPTDSALTRATKSHAELTPLSSNAAARGQRQHRQQLHHAAQTGAPCVPGARVVAAAPDLVTTHLPHR